MICTHDLIRRRFLVLEEADHATDASTQELRSDDGMTVLTVAMSVTNEIELHTSSPDIMYDPE